MHSRSPALAMCVRLLPDGRVAPREGGHFRPPATWQVRRCWRYGGEDECLLKATVEHKTYFANIRAELLNAIETTDGANVRLERFAKV